MPGTCYDCIKKAFSAEQHIFKSGNRLNIHLTCGAHCGKIAAVNYNLLSCLKIIFNKHARRTQQKRFLFQETFCRIKPSPPKRPGAKLFMKMYRKLYTGFSCKKCTFLAKINSCSGDTSNALILPESWKQRGNNPGTLIRRISILEKGFPREHSAKGFSDSTVCACIHQHIGGHPRHRAFSVIIVSPASSLQITTGRVSPVISYFHVNPP